jgi:hypothetical protein
VRWELTLEGRRVTPGDESDTVLEAKASDGRWAIGRTPTPASCAPAAIRRALG